MSRPLLATVRRAPERWLHPWRRRAARAAVAGGRKPGAVLVVCYGNICRSPFAAGLLARALERAGVRVESAGLIGPDRPAPAEAVCAAAAHAVDLSHHRSRLATASLVREADLVIAMDQAQRRLVCQRFGRRDADVVLLGDFDPEPIPARAIRDPVDQPLGVFAEVYDRIERCARSLASQLLRGP